MYPIYKARPHNWALLFLHSLLIWRGKEIEPLLEACSAMEIGLQRLVAV
ncbi:hypothetical protein PG5_27370 [Pseudomonas sp. G5(2012)]|nr:hypothetical protein PG5_27370 [Pseudomonas sp. G5(2012)]